MISCGTMNEECFNHYRDLSLNSIKMKEDLGMSKPNKYANKVKMVLAQTVNIGPKIKYTTSIITLHKHISLSFAFTAVYTVKRKLLK